MISCLPAEVRQHSDITNSLKQRQGHCRAPSSHVHVDTVRTSFAEMGRLYIDYELSKLCSHRGLRNILALVISNVLLCLLASRLSPHQPIVRAGDQVKQFHLW